MNQKSKLSYIRNNIYSKLIENQDILRLLYYTDLKKNPFDTTLPNIEDDKLDYLEKAKVISKQPTVDMANEYGQCSLSMDIGRIVRRDIRNPNSNYNFKKIEVIFFILCNNNIRDLINGDDRVIAIEECLEELFHIQNVGSLSYHSEIIESGKQNCKDGFTARYVILTLTETTSAI